MEKAFYSFLPVNSGQLYPFIYNSIAKPNPLSNKHAFEMISPEIMVHKAVEKEKMGLLEERLSMECRVLCRYLIHQEPNEYVIKKYITALKIKNWHVNKKSFNCFLTWFGAKNRLFARLADNYSRYFFKYSILRKKL